jgi:hypothetical protein
LKLERNDRTSLSQTPHRREKGNHKQSSRSTVYERNSYRRIFGNPPNGSNTKKLFRSIESEIWPLAIVAKSKRKVDGIDEDVITRNSSVFPKEHNRFVKRPFVVSTVVVVSKEDFA